MKKIVKSEFFPLCCLLILGIICIIMIVVGLTTSKTNIVIKNPTYDEQIEEIYANKEDYIGKTIEMQGYYQIIQNGDEEYHFVVQYIPFFNYTLASTEEGGEQTGYYELDVCGLEVFSNSGKYINENDWCIAKGVIEEFTDESDGNQYIRINLTDIKKSSKPEDILDKIYNFDPGVTIDIGVQTVTESIEPISEEGVLSSEEDLNNHNH